MNGSHIIIWYLRSSGGQREGDGDLVALGLVAVVGRGNRFAVVLFRRFVFWKRCRGEKSALHFRGGFNPAATRVRGGAVPGMAVRGMTGMMGDMALSLSSSLGSRRWGKRLVSSATLLSGDDAGMMLSEVSSSSLSILVDGKVTFHARANVVAPQNDAKILTCGT